jgi:hypothetical protein
MCKGRGVLQDCNHQVAEKCKKKGLKSSKMK